MLSAAQIIAENALAGTSAWELNGAPSANINGYAAQFSVNHGERIDFKVNTVASDYRLDIYRLGWYQGLGGRKVATVQPTNMQRQPNAQFNLQTNSVDASNWHVSASWNVPTTAVSGVYVAKLVREDGGAGENWIIFVVRDDEGHSELLFQTSDTTWQAYNTWGGSSLYAPNYPNGRAYAVSYNRPFENPGNVPLNFYFGAEFAMSRFLERNGYDVSYTSGIDTAMRGHEILEHKVFLSVGHDEYWSAEQFENVEAARDAGVNLAFFSGNEIFWKTRWVEDNAGNDFRTIVSYKESLANAKIDPSDVWTGLWRDMRFNAQTDGVKPENSLTGTIFTVNSGGNLGTSIDVSGDFASLRFWRNTEIATLDADDEISLGDRVLGFEWDEDLDNGFRPAGLIPLSSTTRNVPERIRDYGSNYGPGISTHSMTLYRAASGALVFGAGTIQYSWALDNYHTVYNAATDRNIQQATINLFADMGAQPGSLMSGLVRATASTDTLAPISTITSPAAGATLGADQSFTVRGTAQERGGGALAVVEVSVDGGRTWHRATGRENWTYTFTTRGSGSFAIMSRAVDDSGNIETNGPRVEVNPNPVSGIYSLWRETDRPDVVDANDNASVELGVRFTADQNGTITGLRFYKSQNNTGTHVASLWTNNGQLLARATFTNETASGWQQVNFDAPVAITAGTTYVASYLAPRGHYSYDDNYFDTQGISNGPLYAMPQGPAGGNGVYRYSGSSAFPNESYANRNYWVDVVMNTVPSNDHTPPEVKSFANADGSSTLTTDSSIVIKLSESVNVATINSNTVQLLNPDPNSIPGGCCSTPGGWCSGCPLVMGANTKVILTNLSYNATTQTITVTPTTPLSTSSIYTIVVMGGANGLKDLAGNPLANDTAASFLTPAVAASIQSTIWPSTTVPATVDIGESDAVELGVKFTADTNGLISGIRFYKSAGNTGTHVGNLWSSSGQLLATATFTNETASGWQQVNFSTPVAITAGTTYVASYHTNSGHFAVDRNYFTTARDSGLLNVPANGGVYRYGNSAFPTQVYQASNYYVDVVLRTAAPTDNVAPTVTAFTPSAGSSNVATNSVVTARFSEAIDQASLTAATLKIIDSTNNFVPTTISYNASTMTATLTPSSPLAFNQTYTIVALGGPFGIKDLVGNPIAATIGSSFTTVPAPVPDSTPPTVSSTSPANGSTNISTTATFRVTFSEAMDAGTLHLNNVLLLKNATNRVTASVTYDAATRTATITPSAPLENTTSYTIYVLGGATGVADVAGNMMVNGFTSSFTTAAAPPQTMSLWPSNTTPATVDVNEAASLELGVRFTSDVNGYINGIRFYKSAANTGTHIGNLWTSTGQLLATAIFTNETASGWQQVNFSTPVAITAGTTYVASYFAPNGHFSVNRSGFNAQLNSGSLHVPAGGGVFMYGGSSAFPSQSYQNSNYWVDVVMTTTPPADLTPPTVTSTSPAAGASNVATNASVTVVFSEAMNAATIITSTVKLLDGNTMVTANVSYNSSNRTATITPISPLVNSKTYTISVVGGVPGVKDAAGNPLAQTFNASFTTAAAAPVDTTPPTVTGVSPSNGASNVATGSSITVTFSEALNASTVTNSTVRLLQGSTAVTATVSYNATNRTATITPTTALANSTVYTISVLNGASGIKDVAGNALAQAFSSTFTTAAAMDTTPPTVTSVSPTNGASNVALGSSITVTFSEAMNASTITTSTVRLLRGTTAVTATVSYNATNRTATITPTTALANSTVYTISVLNGGSGVKDAAGNALAQAFSSTFTTVAATDTTPPTVTSVSPTNGANAVATNSSITVTFSEALNASTVTTSTVRLLRGTTVVTATVSYNATNRTATITPTSALSNSTTYTVSVLNGTNGVKDAAGNALAQAFSSTFTTAAATPPITLWPSTTTPKVVDVNESPAVELGLRFTSDVNGYITGIRFYKAAGNTGTHIGNLWTSTGQLLATATFTSETASGWQQVNFATPVAITAGTTYIASYYAPNGHFSVDRNFFTGPRSTGPLRLAAGAGVYRYGNSSGFPTLTYANSNYWVDVVFVATT